MTLEEARIAITSIEDELPNHPFVVAHTFSRDGRDLRIALTEHLRRIAKKGRKWKSKNFLTAFKNASYGYDETRSISTGGADGIFHLTRDHKPANTMMRKLFDQYLDREGSGALEVAQALGTSMDSLVAVRLVSHHLRLIGVLNRGAEADTLILVDYDSNKG